MKLKLTLVVVPILALVCAGCRGREDRRWCRQGVTQAAADRLRQRPAPSGSLHRSPVPAASIGQQQLRWAQYYVKQLERS